LSQFTRLTDGQTEFSSLDRLCNPCSAVRKCNVSISGRQSDHLKDDTLASFLV